MRKLFVSFLLVILAFSLFANGVEQKSQNTSRPVQFDRPEEIVLWEDTFEGEQDAWTSPTGHWQLMEDATAAHSPSHFWAIDEGLGYFNDELISPDITLDDSYDQYLVHYWTDPELLRSGTDTPNSIDEVWRLWVCDLTAAAPDHWHQDTFNAYDGNSWWCGLTDAAYDGGWGYGNNWDQWMETPAISITSANATLDFMHRYDSEPDFDFCTLEISVDGGAYEQLDQWDGTLTTWTAVNYDLSAYNGSTIKIKFHFTSDGAWSDEDGDYPSQGAWFVDDIVISDGATVLFEDDADSNLNLVINEGNAPWTELHYDYDRDYPAPTLGWEQVDETTIFNGTVDITDYINGDIKLKFTLGTDDGTDEPGVAGHGLYIDDVEIIGVRSLDPPQLLTAEVQGDDAVVLNWEDPGYIPAVNGWKGYHADITNFMWAGEERATLYRAADFGFSYPLNITQLKHVFVEQVEDPGPWASDQFKFKIYGFDTGNVLYESEMMAAERYPTETIHNTGTVEINEDFYVAIVVEDMVSGTPASGSSTQPNENHSYTGPDPWVAYGTEFLTDVYIEGIGEGTTQLSYTTRDVEGYNIYHALTAGGPYELVDNVDGATLTYTHQPVEGPTLNFYVVRAVYPGGESEDSNEASAIVIGDGGELMFDDGTSEEAYNAGTGVVSAVKFTPDYSRNQFATLKFLQLYIEELGTAPLILRAYYEGDDGMPGDQIFSKVIQANQLSEGWFMYPLAENDQEMFMSGSFFVGVFEGPGSQGIGFDTNNEGNTYSNAGGSYSLVTGGNLMVRAIVDYTEYETPEQPANLDHTVTDEGDLFTWDAPGTGGGADTFEDNFDSGSFDAGWEVIEVASNPWEIIDPVNPYDGMCVNVTWGYSIDNWLITPELEIDASTVVSFDWNTSYYWSVDPNDNSDLFVKISTDGGTTWSDHIWTYGELPDVWENFVWYETVLQSELAPWVGQTVKIALNLVGDDNADNQLDNVYVGPQGRRIAGTRALETSNETAFDSKVATDSGIRYQNRDVASYNVYLDGSYVANVTETQYLFTGLASGNYEFGVSAVYDSGLESEIAVLPVVEGNDPVAPTAKTSLIGNFPNPFNPVTNIHFNLEEAGKVSIEIFNVKGQKIKSIVEEKEAGMNSITWSGNDDNNKPVTSGIYFYKMKSGRFTSTKKMILMK